MLEYKEEKKPRGHLRGGRENGRGTRSGVMDNAGGQWSGGCELSLQHVQLCGDRQRVGGAVASELSQERKILGKPILGRGNGNCKCP